MEDNGDKPVCYYRIINNYQHIITIYIHTITTILQPNTLPHIVIQYQKLVNRLFVHTNRTEYRHLLQPSLRNCTSARFYQLLLQPLRKTTPFSGVVCYINNCKHFAYSDKTIDSLSEENFRVDRRLFSSVM